MLAPLRPDAFDLVDELRSIVSYFWFLGGRPQEFDRCQEANRRAHPLLLAGGRAEIAAHQLADVDVGYYDHPLERPSTEKVLDSSRHGMVCGPE